MSSQLKYFVIVLYNFLCKSHVIIRADRYLVGLYVIVCYLRGEREIMKKTLVYVMAFVLLFSSFAVVNGEKHENAVKEDLRAYAMHNAKVKDVVADDRYTQILVEKEKSEGKNPEELFLYTAGVPVVDLKTGNFVENFEFKKNQDIQFFYSKSTPIMTSLPPKMTPALIAVNVKDAKYSVDVDFFDNKGAGLANRLKINMAAGVKAKNLDGKEVKDFSNKELIVLYTEATTSLPPIATPDKIVVLESVDLATYKEGSDKGVYLRKYYEAVGAKVEWNQADKSTKISLNDKSVSLKNMSGELYIDDKVVKMKGFTVENGVSYIPEVYVKEIINFWMK